MGKSSFHREFLQADGSPESTTAEEISPLGGDEFLSAEDSDVQQTSLKNKCLFFRHREEGLYSLYFLVLQKGEEFRPILDLHGLNRCFSSRKSKVLHSTIDHSPKQIRLAINWEKERPHTSPAGVVFGSGA